MSSDLSGTDSPRYQTAHRILYHVKLGTVPRGLLFGIELFIIIVPWIILSLLTLYWSSWNMYSVLCGIFGNLVIIAVFFLIGRSSTRLLQSEEPFARIAMGFGSWGMIAAGYILINSSIQKKSLRRMWRFSLALSGLIVLIFLISGGVLGDLSILKEYAVRKDSKNIRCPGKKCRLQRGAGIRRMVRLRRKW